jgi:Glycosyl hydrolases family 28
MLHMNTPVMRGRPPVVLLVLALGMTSVLAEDRPFDPTVSAAEMTPVVRQVRPPPQPHFKVQDFGAVGNGTTYDTAAIQKAIDACTGSGGSVILAGGRFVSAQLTLRGKMTFYIAKDAALLGGLEPEDYPVLMPTPPARTNAGANQRSLIYAFAAHDLVLDGEGEIDGRGKAVKMSGKEPLRPSLIRIFGSDRVTVRNLTLRNPRMWTSVYSECRDLTIDSTTTESPPYIENLDGMDICDSQRVVIRNNTVRSEDDGICLKSHGAPGLIDILVENNTVTCHRANAIKIGTASAGPIHGLRIINNTVLFAKYAGLCLESVDGSVMEDVLVRGLEMSQVCQPLFLRLAARYSLKPHDPEPQPAMHGIVIERVRALKTHLQTGSATSTITGIPEHRIRDVTIRDAVIEVPGGNTKKAGNPPEHPQDYPQSNLFGLTPGCALYVRHADQVRLERVTVRIAKPDNRPWLATSDAEVALSECAPPLPAKP